MFGLVRFLTNVAKRQTITSKDVYFYCYRTQPYNSKVTTKMDNLNFTNDFIAKLPVEAETRNFPRQVQGAIFSPSHPTPVVNPSLVGYSSEALKLLDITEVPRPDFAEYVSGNLHVPGSQTISHCYCGHQYGLFSGQLGDGAAM